MKYGHQFLSFAMLGILILFPFTKTVDAQKAKSGRESDSADELHRVVEVRDIEVQDQVGSKKPDKKTKSDDQAKSDIVANTKARAKTNSRTGNLVWQQQVIIQSSEYRQDSKSKSVAPNSFKVVTGEFEGNVHVNSGSFWLGVDCVPTTNLVREQFSIEGGLAVVSIVPQGPVDGKIEKHDIIVSFGDTKLNSVQDLVENIQKSAGESVELQVVRKSASIKIQVAAQERPHVKFSYAPIVLQTRTDNTIDSKQLEQLQTVIALQTADELPQLFVLRPGIQLGSAKEFQMAQMKKNNQRKLPWTDSDIPGVELENVRFGVGQSGPVRIRVDSRLRGISDFTLVKPMWTTSPIMAEFHVKEFDEFASELHQYKTQIRNLLIRLENEHKQSRYMLTRFKESSVPIQVVNDIQVRCLNLQQQLKLRQVDLKRVTSICETVQNDLLEREK